MLRYAWIFLAMNAIVTLGELVVKPVDVLAVYGAETVRFNCSATGDLAIRWKFTNATLTSNDGKVIPRMRVRYSTDFVAENEDGHEELNLEIPSVDFKHAGTYTCADTKGARSDAYSVELTVVKLHPPRVRLANNDSFVIVSELDYAGNTSPRITCVNTTDDTRIRFLKPRVKLRNIVTNVLWTSRNLTIPKSDTLIKCFVEFCASDGDCYSRALESEVPIKVTHPDESLPNKTDEPAFNSIIIVIPLIVAIVLVVCLAMCTHSRYPNRYWSNPTG